MKDLSVGRVSAWVKALGTPHGRPSDCDTRRLRWMQRGSESRLDERAIPNHGDQDGGQCAQRERLLEHGRARNVVLHALTVVAHHSDV